MNRLAAFFSARNSLRAWQLWTLGIAAALFVFGARCLLVRDFGCSLPYWDQWDAEGDDLFTPYFRNKLGLGNFFRLHNDHCIFFTKVVAFFTVVPTGQWDARLEMVVNAFVLGGSLFALLYFSLRNNNRWAGLVLAILGAALFSTACAWENILQGFQSQFSFLHLFAALHLGLSLRYRDQPVKCGLAQLAGLAGVASMAGRRTCSPRTSPSLAVRYRK